MFVLKVSKYTLCVPVINNLIVEKGLRTGHCRSSRYSLKLIHKRLDTI